VHPARLIELGPRIYAAHCFFLALRRFYWCCRCYCFSFSERISLSVWSGWRWGWFFFSQAEELRSLGQQTRLFFRFIERGPRVRHYVVTASKVLVSALAPPFRHHLHLHLELQVDLGAHQVALAFPPRVTVAVSAAVSVSLGLPLSGRHAFRTTA
jgi:hypothetical protein